MWGTSLFLFSVASGVAVLATTPSVPVPWGISNLQISNVRHGTDGFWSFNIIDSPTPSPQGINTTCNYRGNTYYFAIDDPPYHAPCADPSVTFGLFPNGNQFTFNVTHKWGNCGTATSPRPCVDNGTWEFSWDDVRGQENDVQNNFGQAGGFSRSYISMYPTRAKESLKCEFC